MNIEHHPLPSHGTRDPWGLMVHTTGDGIPKRCHHGSLDVLSEAVRTYGNMEEGPHYVISPDGRIAQLREPGEVAWHCGMSAWERAQFLRGDWDTDNRISPTLVGWWRRRWPGRKSPAHLYPSKRPNLDYVGVELVPAGTFDRGSWRWLWGTKPYPESRFSAEQYTSLAMLGAELARDLGWPGGWLETGRLCGHEDVNLYRRAGWCPGAYYDRFNWSLLCAMLKTYIRHSGEEETTVEAIAANA